MDSGRHAARVAYKLSGTMAPLSVRRGTDRDQAALARLCIEATNTRGTLWSLRRQHFDPGAWLAAHAPLVVAGDGGNIVGFATALSEGIPVAAPRTVEALVYVSPSHRRRGAGRAAMTELISIARQTGLWKAIAYALPEDAGARALLGRLDFREVGVLVKHVQLDGGWHDVVLTERLVLAARKSLPSISDT